MIAALVVLQLGFMVLITYVVARAPGSSKDDYMRLRVDLAKDEGMEGSHARAHTVIVTEAKP
jgi:hypothetical protein